MDEWLECRTDNPCACIQGVSQIFKRSFSHRYTYNNKSLFRFSIEILNRNIFVTKRNYPLDSTGKFQFSQCSRNPKPRSLTISLSVSIHKSPRIPISPKTIPIITLAKIWSNSVLSSDIRIFTRSTPWTGGNNFEWNLAPASIAAINIRPSAGLNRFTRSGPCLSRILHEVHGQCGQGTRAEREEDRVRRDQRGGIRNRSSGGGSLARE